MVVMVMVVVMMMVIDLANTACTEAAAVIDPVLQARTALGTSGVVGNHQRPGILDGSQQFGVRGSTQRIHRIGGRLSGGMC